MPQLSYLAKQQTCGPLLLLLLAQQLAGQRLLHQQQQQQLAVWRQEQTSASQPELTLQALDAAAAAAVAAVAVAAADPEVGKVAAAEC
jgi:UPF0716 family protein affecting phage T7 exclusion